MANMVPIDARQSMLLEPSRGSKQTTYFPCDKNKSTLYLALIHTSKINSVIDILFQSNSGTSNC